MIVYNWGPFQGLPDDAVVLATVSGAGYGSPPLESWQPWAAHAHVLRLGPPAVALRTHAAAYRALRSTPLVVVLGRPLSRSVLLGETHREGTG